MPQKKHELSPEITVLQEISYAVVHHQRNVDDLDAARHDHLASRRHAED